jgi:putative peptidoglycan lipid II flippase
VCALATLPGVTLQSRLHRFLFTLASRVTGLVRDLLMASMFGANALTDAFNVAFAFPICFAAVCRRAFSQAFVPVLAAPRPGEEPRALISDVATVLFWVLLVSAWWAWSAPRLLVWLLASGLEQDPDGMDAAVVMTRWMFPYIGFMSLVALSAGVLNTWKRFAVSAATPVLLNLSMIAAAWWLAPCFQSRGIEPIYAMAGGVMLGGVLQLAVQIPRCAAWAAAAHRLSWSAIRQAWSDGVRRILRLMGRRCWAWAWRRSA